MPEKIILEDGSEREVMTQEEIDALNEKASKAADLETSLSENQKLIDELKEGQDPNYKKMREALNYKENLIKQLEKEGKTLDNDGNIVENDKKIDPEELIKTATEEAKKGVFTTLINEKKNKMLSEYDDEEKKVIEHYFTKLSAGEELTVDNIDSYMDKAKSLAMPEQATNKFNSSISGTPPVFETKKEGGFSETDEAKNLAKEIWGDDAYSNEKK